MILRAGKSYDLRSKSRDVPDGWLRVLKRTESTITIFMGLEGATVGERTGLVSGLEEVLNETFHITEVIR